MEENISDGRKNKIDVLAKVFLLGQCLSGSLGHRGNDNSGAFHASFISSLASNIKKIKACQ